MAQVAHTLQDILQILDEFDLALLALRHSSKVMDASNRIRAAIAKQCSEIACIFTAIGEYLKYYAAIPTALGADSEVLSDYLYSALFEVDQASEISDQSEPGDHCRKEALSRVGSGA